MCARMNSARMGIHSAERKRERDKERKGKGEEKDVRVQKWRSRERKGFKVCSVTRVQREGKKRVFGIGCFRG